MSYTSGFLTALQKKLREPLPGADAQRKMSVAIAERNFLLPEVYKKSAVMALLSNNKEQWHITIIRRIENNSVHSGQMAFPGGKMEPGESPLETAFRETEEEIGIGNETIKVLGALSSLYVKASNYLIQPFVGYCKERPQYIINYDEVQDIFEVPVSYILDPSRKGTRSLFTALMPQMKIKVPVYELDKGLFIWGATAMILSEFENVLQNIISND